MQLRRACAALLVAAVLPAAPTLAQDAPPQEERIAQGVSAGGVDLSNLTVDEARVKLELALGQALQQDLQIGVAGRLWTLKMADAKLAFDPLVTAKRALKAQPGAQPTGGGEAYGSVVPLALSHSRLAVRAFVAQIAAAVYRAPRDARLKIGLRRMHVRGSRAGKALDRAATEKLIDGTLDEGATRRLHQPLSPAAPRVTIAGLRRIYGTVITVDKRNFKLRLFKGLKFRKSYRIAHGQPAYPTPTGLFRIVNKQVNPVWSVPNSPWAGELAGTTVAGGSAANPLKARWMGIANGVGIHGTGQEWSIGSRASHGCIRMRVKDVINLYPRVPVGTRVLIR